ncbi:MAG: SMP-30/gluconolaconase/LRE-like region [Pseudomonadota bacterium]
MAARKPIARLAAVTACVGTCLAWALSTPPDYIRVAPAYRMGPPAAPLLAVAAHTDDLAAGKMQAHALPGHDDIVLQEKLGRAFVTARDGWIWKLDLRTGEAAPFVQTALVPSGARAVPNDPDRLLFCASQLHGFRPAREAPVGVYELRISTREIRPVGMRVPLPPPIAPARPGNQGSVVPLAAGGALPFAAMTESNSRPVRFCNDIDVSRDGKRVYMSEPYPFPGAGMGEAAYEEAVSLAHNGRLWMFDLDKQAARLVAQDYHFVDGVLIDHGSEDAAGVEQSIVISETTKFRLLRVFVSGPRAGQDEILQEFLPGMPDGIDRDEQGRLYVAMYTMRTPLMTWMHAHPWIKPLLLRLPRGMAPERHETGYMVLDASGKRPLYMIVHDGSRVRHISKVIPGRDQVYLSSFDRDNRGVHSVFYPPLR